MTARTTPRISLLKDFLHHCAVSLAVTILIVVSTVLVCVACMGAAALAVFITFMIIGASPSTWPPVARLAAVALTVSVLTMVLAIRPMWIRTRARRASLRRRTS